MGNGGEKREKSHPRPLPRMRHGSGGERGRGMRRKLFTLAAALSALLCVGACVLWVRSCWGQPGQEAFFFARAGGTLWKLESEPGRLRLIAVDPWPNREPLQHLHGNDGPVALIESVRSATDWEFAPFAYGGYG